MAGPMRRLGRLVKDLQCPVDILAMPGSPTIPELEALGVAHVTLSPLFSDSYRSRASRARPLTLFPV
jgi:hypothetical protein